MKRIIVLVTTAIMAVVMVAGAATAHTGKSARLKRYVTGDAEIGWSQGPDSPLDPSSANVALNMRVNGATGTADVSAYNPSWLTKYDSGVTGIPEANIRNLSFDFLNESGGGYVGAGSPRLSIIFTDGSVAYLSAYYCQLPISGSTTWSRADFTGATTTDGACAIYVSWQGSAYTNTPTGSAWQALVNANPGKVVDTGWVEQDENTAFNPDTTPAGRARVDRIAMQNHMQLSGVKVVHCPTENSC